MFAENGLLFAKISAVLTVLFAGLNVHQITCSYEYLLDKIEEFKSAISEEGDLPRLARVNVFFYLVLPSLYLLLLKMSALTLPVLALLALKFLASASLGIWTEKSILAGNSYSPLKHNLSRLDNALNLAAAGGVIWSLVISWR
jgi:hypothetical protein